MQRPDLVNLLSNIANQYPEDLIARQLRSVPRIAFNISVVANALYPKKHTELELCDLGGGIGLFSIGCAAYGLKRTVMVDDFDDPINHEVGHSILDLHKRNGVEVIIRDIVDKGIDDIPGTFDVITTFDSMEHWHHSPKRLFRQVVNKLKPGGVFILGVPNCVNMRKRITVLFGSGKWCKIQDWYEYEKFRGHVREPDVNDLYYIARDMALTDIKIYGRNWLGYVSTNRFIRLASKIMDYPLRLRPSLCSDIYLVGRKV